MTASVLDVAAYILEKQRSIPHLKLQKLVYYSQAWGLVWDDEPLFHEGIEAWANGPVVRKLYNKLRQSYMVTRKTLGCGRPSKLKPYQKDTIDAVLKLYGKKTSQWLSDLTHMEDPWKDARKGLSPGERGNEEIPHADMALYYSSLG